MRALQGTVFALILAIVPLIMVAQEAAPRKDAIKAYTPIEARLTIGEHDAEVTIHGRNENGISIWVKGDPETARRRIAVANITETQFLLDIDFNALSKAEFAKNWAGAVRLLTPAISPTLPYLDLMENNATELALHLGTFMYRNAERSGRRAKTEAKRQIVQKQYNKAYIVFRRVSSADWHRAGKIAALKRLLCLIRIGKPKTALHYYKSIEEPMPGEAAYGTYFLVAAELALQRQDYRAAMLAACRSLTLENKDIDTFPDALLIAAQCYEELQEWHRARDVYFEVAKIFPSTEWSEMARRRLAYIAQKELTTGKEKLPIQNVFFAWTEDMNERVAELLEGDEARPDSVDEDVNPDGKPKEVYDKDVDLDVNE